MKPLGLFLVGSALLLVVTVALTVTRASAGVASTTVTEGLRNRALAAKANDFGIDAAALPNGVWGIVMDTRYPAGPATVVALADGSASLY